MFGKLGADLSARQAGLEKAQRTGAKPGCVLNPGRESGSEPESELFTLSVASVSLWIKWPLCSIEWSLLSSLLLPRAAGSFFKYTEENHLTPRVRVRRHLKVAQRTLMTN